MTRLWVALLTVFSLLLMACAREERGAAAPTPAAPTAPAAAPAIEAFLSGADVAGPRGPAGPAPLPAVAPRPPPPPAPAPERQALDIAQRQVISTASVALEVEDVPGRAGEVRTIAESLGGFVENLSSSGSEERRHATITVRVPQPQFFAALERITALGKVLSQSVGSEDVTERFIDLRARLQSAQRQEQSLLSLLQKATSVSDVLTIERELQRVRSEIERLQGQLNFLERRVELATISVALSQPPEEPGEPPSGSVAMEVPDVSGTVDQVKALTASLKGTVDRVFVSEKGGVQRAEISLRVFAADFGQAMASLERQGKVLSKEVSEGKAPPAGAKPSTKPNAHVSLSLVGATKPKTGLIVAIAAPIGGVALAALLAVAYLVGRRRPRGGAG